MTCMPVSRSPPKEDTPEKWSVACSAGLLPLLSVAIINQFYINVNKPHRGFVQTSSKYKNEGIWRENMTQKLRASACLLKTFCFIFYKSGVRAGSTEWILMKNGPAPDKIRNRTVYGYGIEEYFSRVRRAGLSRPPAPSAPRAARNRSRRACRRPSRKTRPRGRGAPRRGRRRSPARPSAPAR